MAAQATGSMRYPYDPDGPVTRYDMTGHILTPALPGPTNYWHITSPATMAAVRRHMIDAGILSERSARLLEWAREEAHDTAGAFYDLHGVPRVYWDDRVWYASEWAARHTGGSVSQDHMANQLDTIDNVLMSLGFSTPLPPLTQATQRAARRQMLVSEFSMTGLPQEPPAASVQPRHRRSFIGWVQSSVSRLWTALRPSQCVVWLCDLAAWVLAIGIILSPLALLLLLCYSIGVMLGWWIR